MNPDFPNPKVPINQFDFQKTPKGWRLQAYCKVCYKAYRDARIQRSREIWKKSDGSSMSDAGIRAWYRKNIGPTMKCSVCKKDLDPRRFAISRSMEKGLHNECLDCQVARSSSVREQAWLADGRWGTWTLAVLKMHRSEVVECAGWSRSVEAGACLGHNVGRRMHADHKIPLRAGGIHDADNFQPLCTPCNERKSDQIDPAMTAHSIKSLVGKFYKHLVREGESVNTIERRLKSALVARIGRLIKNASYLEAIRLKKKGVNGQWDSKRAYLKGVAWYKKVTRS